MHRSQVHDDALGARCRNESTDVVGLDRQIADPAICHHAQPYRIGTAAVDQRIERSTHRAAGEQHVVDEHDFAATDIGFDIAVGKIGARLVIPCHYDLFAFNTASPDEFVAECRFLGQPWQLLRPGEGCSF